METGYEGSSVLNDVSTGQIHDLRQCAHICVCKLLMFSDGVRNPQPARLQPHFTSEKTTTKYNLNKASLTVASSRLYSKTFAVRVWETLK